MARLTLHGISKAFGDVRALDCLTLDVADGEFMVVVGPSGCGKTTLLRIIAGLEEPDQGEIIIGDRRVNGVPPKDRDVALVFQSYALYPHLRVYDNLAYPLRLRRTADRELDRRVRQVADLLRIGRLLDRRPAELSGGEAQRVALGRAIIRDPRVFLMDEPLSNLDAALRLYMRAEIRALQRRLGTTTVYVTHDQAEAMTMGDRIAVLNLGQLQQVGAPEIVYARPANTFVAGFIGSPPMNLLRCRLLERDGRAELVGDGFRFDLSDEPVLQHAARAGEVVLGVRPEDAQLTAEEGTADVRAEVVFAEVLGAEVIVHLKLGSEPFRVRVAPEQRPPLWTRVGVRFNRERLHLFEAASGRLLL